MSSVCTHSLKYLLPPNILQPPIQVSDLVYDVLHLTSVLALDLARLANDHVQREFDAALARHTAAQPTSSWSTGRREADLVVTRVLRREREPTTSRSALRDDAVVVVKGLLDCDVDANVRVRGGGVGTCGRVPGFGFEVACPPLVSFAEVMT